MFKFIFGMIFSFLLMTSSYAQQVPVAVYSSFKTQIPTLKAQSSGPKLAYITSVYFNELILQTYGSVITDTINNRISLGFSLQCVEFIQLVSNASYTSNWRKGNPITAVTPQYSVVATFTRTTEQGANTGYGNDQYSHVGIYVGRDSEGIYILDQNFDGTGRYPVGRIALRYLKEEGSHQNNAANYYVVEKL